MDLKAKIIEAAQRATSKLTAVKVWGEDAHIRVMSGTERDQWESQIIENGKVVKDQFRVKLLVKVLADETGKRLFSDDEIGTLSGMESVEIDRLYTIASKVNGLSKSDVDELTKNS